MDILGIFNRRRKQLDEINGKRNADRKKRGKIKISLRMDEIFDKGTKTPLFEQIGEADPLAFPGYADKLKDLQKRTGLEDACVCASGQVGGVATTIVEMPSQFLMASMGTVVGELVCRGIEYATAAHEPLIIICASGGARMQEGMFSLMQMAKTAAALKRFDEAGGLYVAVLTNPTTGGVTASFAMLADITLAEPGALIGFAGPRVIEQTIGQKLPEGFQRAEFQLQHGFVDRVVARPDLPQELAHLLQAHCGNTKGEQSPDTSAETTVITPAAGCATSAQDAETWPNAALSPAEKVQVARNQQRPHFDDFVATNFEGFTELHGDRSFSDDQAIKCGFATFKGQPVYVCGHIKARDVNSNIACNFGMAEPDGYRKFIRCARLAEKFHLPLITLIDTPGAYPGKEAEERGQGEAIARCLFVLSDLRTPIIAVVCGEGGSGGALALGVADYIVMYENATYSVLSPEGFASILWKDGSRSKEAAGVMKLTAADLLGSQFVDEVVMEPQGGAHLDAQAAAQALGPVLEGALPRLAELDTEALVARRYQKFRKF
jgi:acetyl-CoA carboxylase carboxyl transferase subunit beta